MTEQTKQPEQTEQKAEKDQELNTEQLEQVNGGILIGMLLPAVQKVRQAALGDGSVVPTDQVSLNFTKK